MTGTKKHGSITYLPDSPVYITSRASLGGSEEKAGKLASLLDISSEDDYFGEDTWEKAETAIVRMLVDQLYKSAQTTPESTDLFLGGDLQKQCMATSLGLLPYGVPYLGLYGACSTFAEGLALASLAIDGGFASSAGVVATSHFCTAEREYRTPLVYGNQRQPTAQRTVTGGGAILLSKDAPKDRAAPHITAFAIGKMRDLGIKDASNMGAAMAPAAFETISTFLEDTRQTPEDFDLIVSGDLGNVGHRIVSRLAEAAGIDFGGRYDDCGRMVFDPSQDTHAGASGCGCSAMVLTASLLRRMEEGKIKRLLFAGTGALLSATSLLQGESIPGICHAVAIEI
ncbi:MAG: stage V sporulation protein AD [Clostridia bacterium]|nr:stage V sporulation protein AD [Clostridia bacterium]